MNTSTIEQSEKLLELGIDFDKERQLKEWQDQVDQKGPCFAQGGPPEYKGPALTLDDLHRVFDEIHYCYWPKPDRLQYTSDIWTIKFENINRNAQRFDRTENHAEDWAVILIWLLEENHITATQANRALK